MLYAKVTNLGFQFLIDLRPDGTILERSLFGVEPTWTGTWRHETLRVAPRSSGPGAFSGVAEGVVIEIAEYRAFLLYYSESYLAGVEYREGEPNGTQMLFQLGERADPYLDIERVQIELPT